MDLFYQPAPPPRPEIKPPTAMEVLAKLAAYPDPPTCPLDGTELDIHFHGGVECPACGAAYELGRGNELLPLKEHVEQAAATWPDTVPSEWKLAMAGSLSDSLGPESEGSYWDEPGRDWGTPKHVFRSMSEDHFQQSMRDGVHSSDERGNWLGQAADDHAAGQGHLWNPDDIKHEGTVAGRWAYPGYLANSPNGVGRIVKIEVRPEDGWEPHTEADDEGGYFRTMKPIPTDRFVSWTKPMSGKTFAEMHPSEYPGSHSQYMAQVKTASAPMWFMQALEAAGVIGSAVGGAALVGIPANVVHLWQEYRERYGENPALLPTFLQTIKSIPGSFRGDYDQDVPGKNLDFYDDQTEKLRDRMSAGEVTDYPFLYSPSNGLLHWGNPNGFHEPMKEQLRGQGEQLANDYIHGRWYPNSDNVKWYDVAFDGMRDAAKKPYDDMIRRNCPHRPSGGPQEPSSALPTVEDDWTPQIT